MMLSSCVKDDGTTFVQSEKGEEVSEISIIAMSLLNYWAQESIEGPDDTACFSFIYPMSFTYNTGVKMTIKNNTGLEEVIKNQSEDFYISKFDFPISAELNSCSCPDWNMTSEVEVNQLLQMCNRYNFNESFKLYLNNCFDLYYHITLTTENEGEKVFVNENDFIAFYKKSEEDFYFQPDFKFPIFVNRSEDNTKIEISSLFDFYTLMNDCKFCPDILYEEISIIPSGSEFEGQHYFTTNLYTTENDIDGGYNILYDLTVLVDGVVTDFNPAGNGFLKEFIPGTYEVCMRMTFEDCGEEKEYCEDLIVEPWCPDDIQFLVEMLSINEYKIIPDFEIKDGYTTFFLINEEVITDQVVGKDSFVRKFEPGSYKVCIKIVTPKCPEGKMVCREIFVETICPELYFTYQEDASTANSYEFTRTIYGQVDGTELVDWYLNDSLVKSESFSVAVVVFDLVPGANNVCMKIETEWCPEGVEYCATINVP